MANQATVTWLPRALALGAFALYAFTAPPGLFWLDSPELAAAGFRLGSAHPTGFPLYGVLAKTATLIPIGEIAFRINLLSSACAALAVLWVARLVVESSRRTDAAALAGAACAGITLAVSLTFFRQATVAEVYAPTAALLALTLLLAARVARGAGAGTGLLLAVVLGLGLGLHASFRILAPLPVLLLFLVRLRRGARWPLLAPAVAVLVAFALHLYLPARSAGGGIDPVDWGHPRDAERLYRHVTAAEIRRAFADDMLSTEPLVVSYNARRFAGDVIDELGPIALLAALAGLLCLAGSRPGRWLLFGLGIVIVGDAVYAFWLNPMGIVDQQNGVPLALGIAAAAGLGVAWFSRFLGPAAAYGGATLTVLVALQPLLHGWGPIRAGSASDLPRAWSERGLAAAPPRAIALAGSDSTSSGLLFLGAVEGARPDVAAISRGLLADVERTRRALEYSGSAPGPIDPARPFAAILATGRPLLWEAGASGVPGGTGLVHDVPLSRLLPAPEAAARLGQHDDLGASLMALGRLFTGAGAGATDRIAQRMHAHALTNLGRTAVMRGDLDRAGFLFELATRVRRGHVEAMVNRGVVLSYLGDLEGALSWMEAALAIEPNRRLALVHAARFRLSLGDRAGARRHLERALRLYPHDARARELSEQLDAAD